jgi:glycosyltransferase involved in cell wall biosynthesis
MGKNILVACNGDWYTNLIHKSLIDLGYNVTQINTSRKHNFDYVGNSFPLFIIKIISILIKYSFHVIPNKNYYKSKRIFLEYYLFDLFVSKYIKKHKPDLCFFWTTMSLRSLKTAKELNIDSILFNGSAPLKIFKQHLIIIKNENTVFDSWISSQRQEFDICSKILVESEFIKRAIMSLGIHSDKIHIISPHVKTHNVVNIATEEPINFCTIQINERKGFYKLLKYWNKIDNKNTAKLNLFGSISNKDKKLLLPYSNINNLGFLTKSDYVQSLSKMNVAIFPTYSDAGPRALFECMSMGICPIISERSAGPDHIVNFENGFIIPLNDEKKWEERLKWCIDNPKEVKRIGGNARNYIEEKLDLRFYPIRLNEITSHFLNQQK